MYQNENLHSSSITLITSRYHQLTLISVRGRHQNPQYMKTLTYVGCNNENAILCYHPDIPSFIQPALTVTKNNW